MDFNLTAPSGAKVVNMKKTQNGAALKLMRKLELELKKTQTNIRGDISEKEMSENEGYQHAIAETAISDAWEKIYKAMLEIEANQR